jgi:hypothetical protein
LVLIAFEGFLKACPSAFGIMGRSASEGGEEQEQAKQERPKRMWQER